MRNWKKSMEEQRENRTRGYNTFFEYMYKSSSEVIRSFCLQLEICVVLAVDAYFNIGILWQDVRRITSAACIFWTTVYGLLKRKYITHLHMRKRTDPFHYICMHGKINKTTKFSPTKED